MGHLTETGQVVTTQVRFRGGIERITLAAALVLTAASAQFLSIDPGGAHRDVTLPASTPDGTPFLIVNAADAAENLVIKNAAGDTLATLGQGDAALVLDVDGVQFVAYAWRDSLADLDGLLPKSKLPTGALKSTVIAGGAAGDHALAGVAAGDELVSVLQHVGAGVDVTDIAELVAEFSITGAGTINNAAGTDTTGDKLHILWVDRT